MSEVREWHPTGSIPFGIPSLCSRVIILVHLVKERVLIIESAHVPLLLDVIDVHLDVETLVELLSRDVIRCPGQFSVGALSIYESQSLRGTRLLLRLVETPVGLLEGLKLGLVLHLHLLESRVDQVGVWVVVTRWEVQSSSTILHWGPERLQVVQILSHFFSEFFGDRLSSIFIVDR